MTAPRAGPVLFGMLQTEFGEIGAVWTVKRGQNQLLRVILSSSAGRASRVISQLFPEARRNSGSFFAEVAGVIEGVLKGRDHETTDLAFSMKDLKSFQRNVLLQVRKIPRGETATYGGVASAAGYPEAFRAAGMALARNPFPLIIPCHRVVPASGGIGGYQGGGNMKRHLLSVEGATIT